MTDCGGLDSAQALAPSRPAPRRKPRDAASDATIHVADRFCDRIASQILTGRRVDSAPLEGPRTGSPKILVTAAESLMLAALPRRVDEALLSAMLRVDRRSLRNAFMEVRGQSIYRAILVVRLLTVRRTLERHPDLSPVSVARACGFATYGQFRKEYRADLGLEAPPIADAHLRGKALRDS